MKTNKVTLLVIAGLTALQTMVVGADAPDAAIQAKIDAKVKEVQAWAADPVIINAVKAQNASLPADAAAMNQDKWKALTVLDPFVRGFSKNDAGQFLKAKKTEVIAEAFLSDANGLKIALLAKTSGWSHKGKDKHDVPMTGKTWQGKIEVDESSGVQSIQIAVPVMDGGKPIGSLVVGLSLAKL